MSDQSFDRFDINLIRDQVLSKSLTSEDLFHEIDVLRVRTDDWQIQRFLKDHNNKELTAKALVKAMAWKKEFGLYDRTDEYFPREMLEISDPELFGTDKEGRPIAWANMRNDEPPMITESTDLSKDLMVHIGEKIDQLAHRNRYTQITWLANTGGFRVGSSGFEMLRFLMSMRHYYPFTMARHLLVDVPRVQAAVAKVMVALSSRVNNRMDVDIKFIPLKQLTEFVDWDVIPAEMGGPRLSTIVVPDNAKPLRLLDHYKLSDKSAKKFEEHYKRVKKQMERFRRERECK